MKTLSLKQNSIWNIMGSLFYAFTQWGLLITIAKLSDPENVGVFTLGLALSAPIMLFFNFHLRIALVTDNKNDYKFSEYWTSRLVSSVVFLLVLSIIVILYSENIYTIIVCLFIGLSKFFESLSDIMFGVFQKNKRMDLIAKSQIIKGICTLIAFIITMAITGSLLLSTISMSLIWFLVLILFDLNKTKNFEKVFLHFNKKQQFLIFKYALPLGIAHMIASLNANIPRYIIEYSFGLKELGIYAAIIYIIVAGNNIIIALSNTLLPILSTSFNDANIKRFLMIHLTVILLIIVLGFFALSTIYLFGKEILNIVYGYEFSVYSKEFFFITLVGIVMYIGKFLEAGLSATRKFKVQPYINLITFVLVFIASLLLVPKFGIIGACYALLIAESMQLILRTISLIIFIRNKINDKKFSVSLP
jgi:O-antigen/teichoic acid export membrane protein